MEININSEEQYGDKILSSLKFYTFSKLQKKREAINHYISAKRNYEELRINSPNLRHNINNKLIILIKKILLICDKNSVIKNSLNSSIAFSQLYLHLAELSLEENNSEEIINCYDKIINIFINELTKIKYNFTFTQIQILDLLQKLLVNKNYYFALLYSIKISEILQIFGSIDLISQLNNIIAICYLNLNDFYKAGETLENDYNRIINKYEGLEYVSSCTLCASRDVLMISENAEIKDGSVLQQSSQGSALFLMIISYMLHDTTIAKEKLAKYFEFKQASKIILSAFITLIEKHEYLEAKKILQEIKCIDEHMKHNLIEIFDSQRANYLVVQGLRNSRDKEEMKKLIKEFN